MAGKGKPPAGKKTPNQGASTVITIQEGANRGQGATSAASASNATSKYGTPRESFTFTGAGRISGSRPGSRRQSRTSTPGASASANRNIRAKSAEERALSLNEEAEIRKKEIENKKKNEENKKKKNEENKKKEKEIENKKNEETMAALLERLGAHTVVTRARSTSEPWGRRRGGSFQSIPKAKTSTGSEPARRPSTNNQVKTKNGPNPANILPLPGGQVSAEKYVSNMTEVRGKLAELVKERYNLQKERDNLQKKIDELQGNNSTSNNEKIKNLKLKLKEAEKKIKESETKLKETEKKIKATIPRNTVSAGVQATNSRTTVNAGVQATNNPVKTPVQIVTKEYIRNIVKQVKQETNARVPRTPPGITKTNIERLLQPFKQPVSVKFAPTISVKGGKGGSAKATGGSLQQTQIQYKTKAKTPANKKKKPLKFTRGPATARKQESAKFRNDIISKLRSPVAAKRREALYKLRTPTTGQRKKHVIELIDRVLRRMKVRADVEKKLIKFYESLSERHIKQLFGGRTKEEVKTILKKQVDYFSKKR